MPHDSNVTALRMERQFLSRQADEDQYRALFRDTQPGQNVYWNGFGQPPCLTFRAAFDDLAFNAARQRTRELVKGRFAGGNLGWIEAADMELFACLFQKPLDRPTTRQAALLRLIEREGPLTIQQMKQLTGMLVKEITPALHRLQEAFLVYEDQYDGEWDRAWYLFPEMFPAVHLQRYTRQQALQIVLRRFAFRMVWFDADMARAFYRLPGRDIRTAAEALADEGVLVRQGGGYMLAEDADRAASLPVPRSVLAMHRNDILVKTVEPMLKERYRHPAYDMLQFLLIDGEFDGVVYGHFKNGPYVIEDVVTGAPERREEILEAVYRVNNPAHSPVQRFMGRKL